MGKRWVSQDERWVYAMIRNIQRHCTAFTEWVTRGEEEDTEKYLPWIEARNGFHLSDAHIPVA